MSLGAYFVDVHPHTATNLKQCLWDLKTRESHFTAQSSPLLVPNPTLWLFLPYNLSVPLSPVKNYSSWVAEAAAAAYPIYLPQFCAPLGRVPRANASLVVPLLLPFEAYSYSFSCVGASFLLVPMAGMSAF